MLSKKIEQFIKRNNPEKLDLMGWLKAMPKMEKRKRYKFIGLIIGDKTNMRENFFAFCSAFEKRSDFVNWYYAYLDVYSEWFKEFFAKESIEKCLSLIPTITPWAFERKCPAREIGTVPESFGSKENFLSLLDRILESEAIADFKKIKNLEITAPEALLSDKQKAHKKSDSLVEKTKVVRRLLKEKMQHSFKIVVQSQSFLIEPLFNPLSNKVVLRITAPDKLEYILKLSHTNSKIILDDAARKNHENQLIRADSPYANAMVDFYLKWNNCPMASDVLYYNFTYDAVLYAEHKSKAYRFAGGKHNYTNLLKFNSEVSTPISDLGIYINDLREANFVVDKQTNQIMLIDSGHITYAEPLNPGCPEYTLTMGNLSGRDAVSHFGVMMLWNK